MNSENISSSLLQYDGPDSVFDEITEKDFREAIAYMVAIQPSGNAAGSMDDYREAMAPYEFDINCANRTMERYAMEVLWANPEAMQKCLYKYASDPSFFRTDLPSGTVHSILRIAWRDVWHG